ncbi:hypothetical protein BKA80DRAFT_314603 [Phyllosticta citrichinensis]
MSIHVHFESPDPTLPNNQLKAECETAGKGHELNVPHRSIISQTIVERILHHYKSLRRPGKVWGEFLSLKPDIVRRPDFSRGDLPLDTSHYCSYSLGLVAQYYVNKGPPRRRSKGTPRSQPRGRPRRQAQMPRSGVETPPVAKATPPVVLEGIKEMANGSNDIPTRRDGLAAIMADIKDKFDHIQNVQNTQLKQYKALQRQNEEYARKVNEFSAELQRHFSRIEASQEEVEDSKNNGYPEGSGHRLRSRFFMGGKRLPGQ